MDSAAACACFVLREKDARPRKVAALRCSAATEIVEGTAACPSSQQPQKKQHIPNTATSVQEMSQRMQETTSYQPLQQQSSGTQMPMQSSNEGFNIRQGGNQPENLGWSKQGYGSTGQQQWQQSGQQQQQQGWQKTPQGGQQGTQTTGVGSGGIRAFVKDASGKHVQDSSIRVRVKGEPSFQQPLQQQSFQQQSFQQQQPQSELPKVFRDLPPGETLRPLEEIDERAIWATRSQAARPPETTLPTGDSPYQPFLQKPLHKPLKEATVQEQRQQWSSAGVQAPPLPSKLLAPPKPTRRVRYPPTPEQLLSQKGKLRYTGLLTAVTATAASSQKPLFQEQKYKGEITRPGVDDTRRSSLPPIREEGEMVQMDVNRVNNPEKSIRPTGAVSSKSNIVLADAPPHVEAVPLDEQEQQQRHAGKEGFFGKIRHMFDKKEA